MIKQLTTILGRLNGYGVWIALVLQILALIFVGGRMVERIEQVDTRLVKLEVKLNNQVLSREESAGMDYRINRNAADIQEMLKRVYTLERDVSLRNQKRSAPQP